MAYISRTTGQHISEQEHIQQSIEDIFTTPQGSRVRRRDYGFPLNLIDQPINPKNRLRLFSAAAKALRKWEPRINVQRISSELANGKLTLIIRHNLGTSQVVLR